MWKMCVCMWPHCTSPIVGDSPFVVTKITFVCTILTWFQFFHWQTDIEMETTSAQNCRVCDSKYWIAMIQVSLNNHLCQTFLSRMVGSPEWMGKSGVNSSVGRELEQPRTSERVCVWFDDGKPGCRRRTRLCRSTAWKFQYPSVNGMDKRTDDLPHLGQSVSNFDLLSSFAKKTRKQWSWHKNPHRDHAIKAWVGVEVGGASQKKTARVGLNGTQCTRLFVKKRSL